MAGLELPNRADLPAQLSRRLEQLRLPRIAEWLLIGLIAFLLAKAAIAFFAPLPVPKGDMLAALPASERAGADVSARSPFPQAAAVDETPIAAGPDLTEPALDLGLTGVWPEAEGGSAIIRRPDGKERRFAVGEEIVSGVKLIAVFSDQVVIEQGGVRESLRFESKAPAPRAAVTSASQPATGDNSKIQNLSSGANLFGGVVRLEPGQNSAGQPAIVVYAGQNRAAFESAGLRDGDVLVTINGAAPPQSPGEMVAMINQAAQAGAARLVVERNGERLPVALSFNGSGNQ